MTAAAPDPSEPPYHGPGTQTNDASPVPAAHDGGPYQAPAVSVEPADGGAYEPAGYDAPYTVPSPPVDPDRRGAARQFALGGVILLALAAIGIPLGLVWQALGPRVELVATETGFRYITESPEGYAGDDGVFTFLGLGVGVAAALAVWLIARRSRGPVQVGALVLGALVSQFVAWRFGEWWGRRGWEDSLESAQPGEHLFRPPKLLMVNLEPGRAWDGLLHLRFGQVFDNLQFGAIATMALAAVCVYTIMAGWSRYQTLNKHTEPAVPTMQTAAPDAAGPVPGRLPS